MNCERPNCNSKATFELHIPWSENEFVCAAHARVRARADGIVAEALETADEELPDGAT